MLLLTELLRLLCSFVSRGAGLGSATGKVDRCEGAAKFSIGDGFSVAGAVFCSFPMADFGALVSDEFLLWFGMCFMVAGASTASVEFEMPSPLVWSVESIDGMLGKLGGLSWIGGLGNGLR